MTKETINTSTRDTDLVKDQGKTPWGGKPFEILLLLDCHKMLRREYNEKYPSTRVKLKGFDYQRSQPTINPIYQSWKVKSGQL